ncbi:MAG: tRNA cyclic N6-threonylcarbamoyladenosine(37) synthase TcdA [Gammaproteobacteria bacterium]|nr:tRNA cyclic N6-threonylcarbamoyladenosine(37) synthase TcdA [Gammaproteobacteria bacterium]
MHSEQYLQSFDGLTRIFGSDALGYLNKASFCIIGIGGVGSWCAEAAARSGIGHITLIDHDNIELSNINRQCHTTIENCGQSKVDAMQQRILLINSECDVTVIDDLVTHANLDKFELEQFDYVIDAIDHVTYKTALIHFCRRNKIPLITTGGAGGLTDPSKIGFSDLTKTTNDPLLAKVRSNLRYQYHYSRNPKRSYGIDCVYSTQQSLYPTSEGKISYEKPTMDSAKTLDCATGLGSFVAVTASFGFAAIARAITKYLAKQ